MGEPEKDLTEAVEPSSALDYFEKLAATSDYRELTETQKRIILAHLEDPNKNGKQLAEAVGCTPNTVYRLTGSEKFAKITTQLGAQVKASLVLKAMRRLERLIDSRNENVALSASLGVLKDAKLIESEPKTIKQDNRIQVMWANGESPVAKIRSEVMKDKAPTGGSNGAPIDATADREKV